MGDTPSEMEFTEKDVRKGVCAVHPEIKLTQSVQQMLQCPVCQHHLDPHNDFIQCSLPACGRSFPVVDGIPIIIDEEASVFSTEHFTQRQATFFPRHNGAVTRLQQILPSIDRNVKSYANYIEFSRLLAQRPDTPRVLVLGGSIVGDGMRPLLEAEVELVETDVAFGPRTALICDAHDIPFEDNSFDGVVVQAVLEHVVDPWRCVREIHRILKQDGYVYAETPFIQQVHGGRYDFTRFTHLGHRWLFREFEEIASGASCGPGMALAWTYQYFLLSFTTSKLPRMIIRGISQLTAFPLKYFDSYLINKSSALDAASGVYFLGRKSDRVLTERELVGLYRGAL